MSLEGRYIGKNLARLDRRNITPVAQSSSFCLTTRWSGPGIQRQKPELLRCGCIRKLEKIRSPAAHLPALPARPGCLRPKHSLGLQARSSQPLGRPTNRCLFGFPDLAIY